MALTGVSAAVGRVLSRQKTRKPILNTTRPGNNSATHHQILEQLEGGHISKAVSLLFPSLEPVSYWLYERLLRSCSSKSLVVQARKVVSHLVTFSPLPPIFLLNRAIETYGGIGCLSDARELFEQMPERDGGSWNALITACAKSRDHGEVFRTFVRMNRDGIRGTETSFSGVLKSCGFVLDLGLLRQLHCGVVKHGYSGNLDLETSVVDVYGKCGAMSDARRVFDEMERPSDVSWNVIVRRYVEMGLNDEAVAMFFKMLELNVRPLNHTVSSVVLACSRSLALEVGMVIHAIAVKLKFLPDTIVSTSVFDMYVKCGRLESARRVFDQTESKDLKFWTSAMSGYAMNGITRDARELFDLMPERNIISWNAMLGGYVRASEWDEALDFLTLMRREVEGIDNVTLVWILNVCSGVSDVQMGKQAHGFIYRHGYDANLIVANALLDMYGKCGAFGSANVLFRQMSELRDEVSWNALLTGLARVGRSEQALSFFEGMQLEAKPSKYTLATLLAGCANVPALSLGKATHGFLIRNGYDLDVVIRGAMVDMYSKCRCFDYAIQVFEEAAAATRDLMLWNSMIRGCYRNGRSKEVFELFMLMEGEGVKPDHVTFLGILRACIREGHVELGFQYFSSMSTKYFILPQVEHYDCMVELYCKYGCLRQLEEFLLLMPFDPPVQMLTRMHDACQKYGWSKLGAWTAKRLHE
ncbi:Pentatricopeptide repeat-containing protein [Raphanus sativus]|uniref:Pentatricopeptide repeat-containing protein At3g26540 n=1 Tax=Raphanus sativus TaxID=3726 RepID=A0A6J0KWN9_RAPSA|nr:pentatricopeptide repeat-containing protein At3g26540 [Raphanus sativus]KAJ4877912.1 Pentatricopeptide repeat-containing protein [Raphanus sativus]